jgi:hypothetical protein
MARSLIMKKLLICALLICGCNGGGSRNRPVAKDSDYIISDYEHSSHEYLIFKEKKGDLWETVAIVHNPNCLKCRLKTK